MLDDERQRFIAEPEALAALDLRLEDLALEDARAEVIAYEHPEFGEDPPDEIDGPNGPMNPRLHLAMHGIVAQQLWDNDPAEVWTTAQRLLKAGYDRHEILHMLSRPVTNQLWSGLHDDVPYDRERHIAELEALPDSWERERVALSSQRRHDDGRRKARRAARAARRRNRRSH